MKIKRSTETQIASMHVLVPLFKERLGDGQQVKFTPKGISMLPMIRQGIDTVTLSPITDQLKKYDIVLYMRDNGNYVLHRIVEIGETYTAMGDNQFVKERGLRADQMIARVSSFTRGEREYSIKSVPYIIYCRVWYHSRFFRRVYRATKNRIGRIFRKRRP